MVIEVEFVLCVLSLYIFNSSLIYILFLPLCKVHNIGCHVCICISSIGLCVLSQISTHKDQTVMCIWLSHTTKVACVEAKNKSTWLC
jgi:hypothetical protein